MAGDSRERILESLAVASAIGFIAIIVAAAALFADSAATAGERARIAELSRGRVAAAPARFDDPAFARVHAITGGTAPYGAVLSLASRQGAFRAAVLFRGDGSVVAARSLGGRPDPVWLENHPVEGGASTRGGASDAVSGVTESYLDWSDAVARASAAVSRVAEAGR